jgi:DNA-directed RNA polymerase specialized sigma24 family protein
MRSGGMTDKRLEFTGFYDAARDDCLQIVRVSVGDRQLAEDLVAEAFTRAWASWRTVRQHPAPRAWVVRTAAFIIIDLTHPQPFTHRPSLGDRHPTAEVPAAHT